MARSPFRCFFFRQTVHLPARMNSCEYMLVGTSVQRFRVPMNVCARKTIFNYVISSQRPTDDDSNDKENLPPRSADGMGGFTEWMISSSSPVLSYSLRIPLTAQKNRHQTVWVSGMQTTSESARCIKKTRDCGRKKERERGGMLPFAGVLK